MSDPIGKEPRLTSVDFVALREFRKAMFSKLSKNAHKDHWKGYANHFFLGRIDQELVELRRALIDNVSAESIIDECADIANFAMMIADNARTGIVDDKE